MDRLISLSRRFLVLAAISGAALVIVAIGLYVIFSNSGTSKSLLTGGLGANPSSIQQSNGPRDAFTNPQAGITYIVPPKDIPQTQTARYNASPLSLLPDHWSTSQNADEDVGPANDTAQVSVTDRQALIGSVTQFLTHWETFTPPSNLENALQVQQNYQSSLAPWVYPADLVDIVQRVDNIQGGGVCPLIGCTVGSHYVSGNAYNDMNVRYDDGIQAYVTGYGDVTYHQVLGISPLNGVTFERSYGFLLQYVGNQWLVTRAAADSVGSVQ